jgi:hypothetical protein
MQLINVVLMCKYEVKDRMRCGVWRRGEAMNHVKWTLCAVCEVKCDLFMSCFFGRKLTKIPLQIGLDQCYPQHISLINKLLCSTFLF